MCYNTHYLLKSYSFSILSTIHIIIKGGKMKIAICDDEKFYRTKIKDLISNTLFEYNYNISIYEFISGHELCKSNNFFDVIFIDYNMENGDGLSAVNTLRKKEIPSIIIFISRHPEIVFESLKYDIFRFLIKPIDYKKFREAILSAIKRITNTNNTLVIKNTNQNYNSVIPEKDILYVQADSNYSIIFTTNESYRYSHNITHLQKRLKSDFFFRIHRSYIVNLTYITSFSKEFITLTTGEKVKISTLKYKTFQEKYKLYLKPQI